MIQLLALVTRVNKISKQKNLRNFACETLSLNVRIKGPARKTYAIPKGIRGKIFTVKRTFLKDWTINKGSLIVLSPEETRRCIRTLKKTVKQSKHKNFIRKDIDGDGLCEIVNDNPFIETVISPHYGGRVLQFWNKETGKNQLYGGGFFKDRGYIELGGIEETLSKNGMPDELWKTPFKNEFCEDGKKLLLSAKMKKQKGISVGKRFTFFDDFPGFLKTTEFSYKPERKKQKKKKSNKTKIKLSERIFFAIGGIPDFKNIYCIPTRDKMNYVRFNKPLFKREWGDHPWWEWTHVFFSPEPGYIILKREDSSEAVLLFFDTSRVNYIWTGDKKRTPRLYISYKQESLEPKKVNTYQLLTVSASVFSYTKNELLFATKGKPTKSNVPVSFVYYSKRRQKQVHILLLRNKKEKLIEMKKLVVNGIRGSFLYHTEKTKKDAPSITGMVKKGKLKVRLPLE